MKVLYLFLALLLFSCKKDADKRIPYLPDKPLVGRWLLTEVNSNIGDGTMTGWHATPGPSVILEFHEDGQFRCITDNEAYTYQKEFNSYRLDTIRGTRTTINILLVAPDRNEPAWRGLVTVDGKALELAYPCIEGCYYRFKRQDLSSR